ncbi:hypothetical protein MUGA111182_11045 [Mucilaginibacter galii]|uniref:DUF1440 domain-containing protein n=1 Tax=Mucilaginibacter galii TaxID=2005073 RepID=A0A917JAU7_9SPHI|nr:hypothetical protein [Mucilaginibacter galii]GGI50681.1 hypothetical protein GCM10011425_18930 [Mucilaginibacter galii]
MRTHQDNALGELAGAIGKGLLAGLAGTAAITLSQMIEMKITKREPSDAPVKVASQVTGAAPADDSQKEKLNNEIHYAYGTSWGIVRGLLGFAGLKGIPATLVHFGAIWATELVMLPKYDAAPPVNEQEPKSVAIDALHHAVYAVAAGLVYDALDAGSPQQQKLNKLNKLIKGMNASAF